VSVLGDITWREPPTGDRVTYCLFDITSFSLIRVSAPRRHAPSNLPIAPILPIPPGGDIKLIGEAEINVDCILLLVRKYRDDHGNGEAALASAV
jgi:hypothetical protein